MVKSPLCPVCGRYFPSREGGDRPCGTCLKKRRTFRRAKALALYEGPVMEAIHRMKYQGRLDLAKPFAGLVLESLPRMEFAMDWDIVVPVPLHIRRLRERGFNQSALLAGSIGKTLGIPVDVFSLKKTRTTPPQVGLTMKERMKNVKGVFQVMEENVVKGRSVLLCDDVFTTGATVSECAHILRKAGAKSVDVLTLARTP